MLKKFRVAVVIITDNPGRLRSSLILLIAKEPIQANIRPAKRPKCRLWLMGYLVFIPAVEDLCLRRCFASLLHPEGVWPWDQEGHQCDDLCHFPKAQRAHNRVP